VTPSPSEVMRVERVRLAALRMAARSEAVRDDESGTSRFVLREDEEGGGSTNSARGTPSEFLEKDFVSSASELSAVKLVARSPGGGGSINSALGTLSCCACAVARLCDAESVAGGGSINSALGASTVSRAMLDGDGSVGGTGLFSATVGGEAVWTGSVTGGTETLSALCSLGEEFCGGGGPSLAATIGAAVAAGIAFGRGAAATGAFDLDSLGLA